MKLLLLPLRNIASSRIFLYGTALKSKVDVKPTIQDRIVNKAGSTWTSWESATSGWKEKVVRYGNKAISRVDYREHSLKSIMSQSSYERYYPDEHEKEGKVTLNYPSRLTTEFIQTQTKLLADEGYPRHRQKLIYSFVLMPFTAPFMLVPIVPNLPFFYVAFRAWSHYRAMQGSTHLKTLMDQNRIDLVPSKSLDSIYREDGSMDEAKMKAVLSERIPDMPSEIERATRQVIQQEEAVVSEKEIEANRTRSRTGLHK